MINKFIIACPDRETYDEPPKDQPGSELTKCPYCNNDMWISARKRKMRQADVFIACYACLTQFAKNKSHCFKNVDHLACISIDEPLNS